MAAKPSELGGMYFKTQTERDEYIRSILIKDGIRVLTGQELAIVYDLLLLHPDADRKIGVGVKQIEVRWSPQGTHYCFWVVRVDGNFEDFSKDCDYDWDKLIINRRQSAYREAIQKQITDYRFVVKKSNQRCELPGCTSYEDIQVDHQSPTFKELVSAFEKDRDNIPTEFEEALGTIYSKRFRESDSAYRKAWQEYHKKHATLRLLCKEHHQARKRKEGDKQEAVD